LGFEEETLSEFKQMLQEEKKPYVKRMIAWELALWYANKYTMKDAEKALSYVHLASEGERNKDQLRRLAIIEAESLFHINKVEESRQVIQQMLDRQVHPDLYLAMANLEVNPHAKLAWLNKAYAQFDLSPV